MMQRGVATTVKVFAFSRTNNTPVTGGAGALSCKVSIDGGARVALADTSATELEDGYYVFDVAASETNGTTVDFFPESSTANVQVIPVNVSRYTLASTTGYGARTVTITVTTSGSPVSGATVRISKSGQSFSATTNLIGTCVFNVDDGVWSVAITAANLSFSGASLSINQDVSVSYPMTVVAQVYPPAFAGLCNVLFSVIHLGQPVQNASVQAILEDENPTVNSFLLSRQVNLGVTDANGNCIITMVQYSQFTRGGVYRIKVADSTGRIIHDRKITVPDQSTANAEDLPDAR